MPSSVVNKYLYFPETEILRIIYQSGAVYDYLQVPEEIFEKIKTVQSKGRFLNYIIKPKFQYKKVKKASARYRGQYYWIIIIII